MSDVVLNSWLLTRLLTSGEEDFKHVSTVLKKTLPVQLVNSTHNVDFVHIFYIFNYEIMPAMLPNTFLFTLQGSALAYLRYGGRY